VYAHVLEIPRTLATRKWSGIADRLHARAKVVRTYMRH